MKTLYELVLGLADSELDDEYNTTEKRKIIDDVNDKVKTKLGHSSYQRFENYCSTKKTDSDLKELANEIVETEQFIAIGYALVSDSDVAVDIKFGYKITTKLYNELDKAKFDAKMALVNYWDN